MAPTRQEAGVTLEQGHEAPLGADRLTAASGEGVSGEAKSRIGSRGAGLRVAFKKWLELRCLQLRSNLSLAFAVKHVDNRWWVGPLGLRWRTIGWGRGRRG